MHSLSVLVLLSVLVSAMFAGLIAPEGPGVQNLDQRFAPVFRSGHFLGTDDLGRDTAVRLLYGTQPVILVGLVAVGISLVAGVLSGFLCGFGARSVDVVIELIMDAVLSVPTVLLCLAILTALGYGLMPVLLALAIVFTPVIHRTVRAEVLRSKHLPYVEAALVMGRNRLSISVDHILPQLGSLLLVQATNLFSVAIGVESSLSYLGLGIQPPDSSWGLMLKDSRDYLFTQPQLALIPGIALVLTILSLNFLSDRFAERQGLR